jgi:two-component system nitrogen regulation response regulator NtrX
MNFLTAYHWPGNIRELKNLVERIVVMYNGDRLGIRDLEILLQRKAENSPVNTALGAPEAVQTGAIQDIFKLSYNEAKELFEKRYLEFRLMQNDGVISRTAESIGMYPSNLHTKLRKYKLRTDR